MRITPDELQKKWDDVNFHNRSFLRIDTDHPLEWYIGYLSINQKTLLLISDEDMGTVDSSKSMDVKRGLRESDNRWTLTFELLREEQHGVFMNFCCDIIEFSRQASNSKDALQLVVKRYKQWNRLLEYQRKGVMDEGARKGLIGELLFLRQRLESGMHPLDAIHGWIGPEGGDQDFVYADGWHEIKTISLSAATVSISSLEQLDNNEDGELIVMRVEKCAPEKKGAFSLNNLVQTVSELVQSESDALDLLISKLNKYGYINLSEYSQQSYFYFGFQPYLVNSSFPKLIRAYIPEQITVAQYSLSLAGLIEWER